MATDTGAVTGALSRAAIKAGESATDVAWDAGTVLKVSSSRNKSYTRTH